MKKTVCMQGYFILFIAVFMLSCTKKSEDNIVRLAGSMSPGEFLLVPKVLKKFKAKEPNINVKYELISGNYIDLIQTRIAGGTPPSVFYLDDLYAPDFISKGVLEPLDKYIKRDNVNLEDFYPNLLSAFQRNGKTYGLPKDYNTLGLFYNKEMFAKAKLNPPKNWKELYNAAKTLTGKQSGEMIYGLCLPPDLARWLPFLYQVKGDLVSESGEKMAINSPEGLKALKYYVKFINDKVAVKPTSIGTTWCGQAFGLGKVAMAIEGGWLIPSLMNDFPKLKYWVAPLPKGEKNATIAFTVAYAIPKRCKNKEEAWQLLKYLTGREGMKAWTELGMALPSRKSVAKESDYYKKNPQWKALIESTKFAFPWQFEAGFGRISRYITNDFESVFLGLKTPEEALRDIEKYGNKRLKYNLRK